MAELDTSKRKKIADKKFGLPEKRAYPVEDKAHARNAKARASQQAKEGHLSKGDQARIDRKADAVLNKS